MFTEKQLKKQLLELSILTLITVVVWIGYEVYSALTTPSEVTVSKEELAKVPVDINLKKIEELKSRILITDEMLDSLPVNYISLETVAASPSTEIISSPTNLEEVDLESSPSAEEE